MSNVFKSAATRYRDSRIVIIICGICFIGMCISLAAFVSDYKSSYNGYLALPTQKVNEWVWLIALLPQVGQVIFGTAALLVFELDQGQTSVNWLKVFGYGSVTFGLFLFDSGTDVWFKTFEGTADGFVWFIAIIESVTVYTIGSEILMIVSWGLFLYTLPLALRQLDGLIKDLSGNSGNGSAPTRR